MHLCSVKQNLLKGVPLNHQVIWGINSEIFQLKRDRERQGQLFSFLPLPILELFAELHISMML